jgi:hypothetical protein
MQTEGVLPVPAFVRLPMHSRHSDALVVFRCWVHEIFITAFGRRDVTSPDFHTSSLHFCGAALSSLRSLDHFLIDLIRDICRKF